jgi:ubiquitin-protein ligase
MRRVLRDYKRILENSAANGIYIKPVKPDSMDAFYVMLVGPKGPYEGVLIFFTLEPWVSFNPAENSGGVTYPASPPRVLHASPYSIRIHPNLYRGGDHGASFQGTKFGKTCLSFLNTWMGPPWTPMLDFEMIFVTIKSILDDEPLRNEPSYERGHDPAIKAYSEYVQFVCLHETISKCFLPVLKGFIGSPDNIDTMLLRMFEPEIRQIWQAQSQQYFKRMAGLQTLHFGQLVTGGGCYGDRSFVGKPYTFQDLLAAITPFLTSEPIEKEKKEKKEKKEPEMKK